MRGGRVQVGEGSTVTTLADYAWWQSWRRWHVSTLPDGSDVPKGLHQFLDRLRPAPARRGHPCPRVRAGRRSCQERDPEVTCHLCMRHSRARSLNTEYP